MSAKVFLKSQFAEMIEKYVSHMRNNLGRNFRVEKCILYAFDNFCVKSGHSGKLTEEIFLKYCLDGDILLPQRGKRYRTLYNFYQYCTIYDDTLPQISRQPIDGKRQRYISYIYTEQDIAALLNGAGTLMKGSKRLIVRWQCVIGMLACTGMRVGEVLNLNLDDIDWERRILTVRNTKFRKSRLIPVHESVLEAIRRYLSYRYSTLSGEGKPLFVSSQGHRWSYGALNMTFNRIMRYNHIGPNAVNKPRIHDLRHTFAVTRVVEWYKQGVDVQQELATLSTYMGHSHYEDTVYYLESANEILKEAAKKFQPLEVYNHEMR